MKKRKSPILLITLLIICIAVVIGFNYSPSKGGDKEAPPPNPEAQTGPARTNTPSVVDLKSKAQQGLKGGPPPSMANPMARAKASGMPEEAIPPSIENPAVTSARNKPKPNDSSISTQWYTDEAKK